VVDDLLYRPVLDDLARIHHDDPVGDGRDDAEVVADEEHRQAVVADLRLQEPQDLGLDGDIEGRRRLIGDEELRAAADGRRGHDPLGHSAGQLMRVRARPTPGLRDPHVGQQVDAAVPGFTAADASPEAENLADLIPHPARRVERRFGLLEEHRDPGTADAVHLAIAELEQVDPVEEDLAADDLRRRRQEASDGEGRHALARAGLADEGHDLASADRQVDAVDRGDDPVARGQLDAKVPDLDEGPLGRRGGRDLAGRLVAGRAGSMERRHPAALLELVAAAAADVVAPWWVRVATDSER
jgi:hypothetical protein